MRGALSLLVMGAVAAAGVAAGVYAPFGGASPTVSGSSSAKVVRITVKASEFKYVLSRSQVPAAGTTVIFTVVNKGKLTHDFKIAGKKTKILRPGQKATLKVKFTKKGKFAYVCTVPSHAKLGMKGTLFVGVTPTTRINVTATEFAYKLSKTSVPVVGTTVIFTVVNKGKISHDFKIAGKKTKILNPGQKATLTVKFTKKGKFAYLCTVPGHAKLGMKGTLAVGVTTPPPTTTTPPPTTTTPPPPQPPPPSGTVGNAQTTVQVGMFEYRFDLSQRSVPSGQVTFVITNKGKEVHNFTIGGHAGKLLPPGGTETYTVGFAPGSYPYVCDVIFHIDRGMLGTLTVTQ